MDSSARLWLTCFSVRWTPRGIRFCLWLGGLVWMRYKYALEPQKMPGRREQVRRAFQEERMLGLSLKWRPDRGDA